MLACLGWFDALELTFQNIHHMGVAAARCFASKYYTNQPYIIPRDGCNKVKTRRVDITCLDAVSAIKFAQ